MAAMVHGSVRICSGVHHGGEIGLLIVLKGEWRHSARFCGRK